MGKYLSFGKYNIHYKYMLIYLLFKLINISVYELNFYDVFNGIKIFFLIREIFKNIPLYANLSLAILTHLFFHVFL